MAVRANVKGSVVAITCQEGLNESGAPILRQRSIANIKADALDQDVFDVVQALYGLQEYPLITVRRDNRFELSEA